MHRLVGILVVVVGVASPSVALSQTPAQPDAAAGSAAPTEPEAAPPEGATFRSLFSDLGREVTRKPSKGTAITLALGSALALAAYSSDQRLPQRAYVSAPLDRVFEAGEAAGNGWVQGGAAVTTFFLGYAFENRRTQVVGADLVQAQIMASVMTQGLKLAVGRKRPDQGRYSFPSGHTSATFANAAVLQRHFGWKAGLPAYGFAGYVAFSRVQENSHFASDVIFGATLGLVAGRTVTVGGKRTRFAVTPVAVPGGGGVSFTRIQ
jgi:membrane-associated phospholipid phosphatase